MVAHSTADSILSPGCDLPLCVLSCQVHYVLARLPLVGVEIHQSGSGLPLFIQEYIGGVYSHSLADLGLSSLDILSLGRMSLGCLRLVDSSTNQLLYAASLLVLSYSLPGQCLPVFAFPECFSDWT